MSLEEMDLLGWDSCDIIIVTGDAYVDHASFGMAIVGRFLESQGSPRDPIWLLNDVLKREISVSFRHSAPARVPGWHLIIFLTDVEAIW